MRETYYNGEKVKVRYYNWPDSQDHDRSLTIVRDGTTPPAQKHHHRDGFSFYLAPPL